MPKDKDLEKGVRLMEKAAKALSPKESARLLREAAECFAAVRRTTDRMIAEYTAN